MRHVYISPHLDDVALSCGALVWQQAMQGIMVEIWTICAGDPPDLPFSPFANELHARWGAAENAVQIRREEDRRSCEGLGAGLRHFPVPDCIYRVDQSCGKHLYPSAESIFGDLNPSEGGLVKKLAAEINELAADEAIFYVPLGIGNHVDHQLSCSLVTHLKGEIRYYADYPYAIDRQDEISRRVPAGYQAALHVISQEDLIAWQASVAAHESQISTFWPDLAAMRQAIAEYANGQGGIRIWEKRGD